MNYRIRRKSGGLLVLLMILLSGCGSNGSNVGASGSAMLVTVTDQAGNPQPNADVVLGDSNGAMRAYGRTDDKGQITFNDSPTNATVSVAFNCLSSGVSKTSSNSLSVQYDVNGPVNLQLWSCPVSTYPPLVVLGSATVNVTNAIAGITQNTIQTTGKFRIGSAIAIGGSCGRTSLITQQTLTITSGDLQEDGKLSIIVTGKDANGRTIGYGALLDQTFTDGMTANIAVDQPMGSIQYQVENLSATPKNLYTDINQSRTGIGSIYLSDCHTLSSATTITTLDVPYIPGFGDQFHYSVSSYTAIDRNTDGSWTFSDYHADISGPSSSASPTNQIMQLLPVPSGLTVNGANTSTPTLSWSGLDPSWTTYKMGAMFRSGTNLVNVQSSNLSAKRTRITLPELPDSLVSFRPTGGLSFSIYNSAGSGDAKESSSSNYLNLH